MKKIHVIGLLLALFAISLTAVASASALEALWLKNGESIATAQAVETEGELELGNSKSVVGEVAVLCSGAFAGTAGPNAADEITAVLNLAKEEIVLGGKELVCTNVKNCPSPLVWPEHLPWLTVLELMGTETSPLFLDLFFAGPNGLPGWTVDCSEPLIGLVEETCEGETSADLENDVAENDVLGSFNRAELEAEGLQATCKGEKTGFIDSTNDGPGLTFLVGGGTLAVSED